MQAAAHLQPVVLVMNIVVAIAVHVSRQSGREMMPVPMQILAFVML